MDSPSAGRTSELTAESDRYAASTLSAWDAASIIVGIVVGTAIFRSPPIVLSNSAGPWQALGLWAAGGALSLVGALCYAELATTYPRSGGDYEYLGRAYGRGAGFLFGWAHLTVIGPSTVGAMAYVFADYGDRLRPLSEPARALVACGLIAALAIANILGVSVGKAAQNALTAAKVLGLLFVVGAAFWAGRADVEPSSHAAGAAPGSIGLALVFVLYAYGGWNDAAFVAAEVRDRRRNVPLALLGGIGAITLIYLAVNAAYLWVLGYQGASRSEAPAADVLRLAVGPSGEWLVSGLVMVSAVGTINGMILTAPRVYATLGADHAWMGWLGAWNRRSAPFAAMLAQATVSIAMVAAVGTSGGRGAIDRALAAARLRGIPWEDYFGGFETLVAATAPVFWAFFLLSGVGYVVLRLKDGRRPRPFRAPLFPLPPLAFCGMCGFMLHSSVDYARGLTLIAAMPVALGALLYVAIGRRAN